MIIVIDGPEKAGKTTLIRALTGPLAEVTGLRVNVRHWGPVKPDDRVYTPALQEDVRAVHDTITVWDRTWASEHVYGFLLDRDRRLARDPLLGEWLHGRVIQSVGSRYMLLSSTHDRRQLRDDSDIAVDPNDEMQRYWWYADRFGWSELWNNYTAVCLRRNVDRIIGDAVRVRADLRDLAYRPPQFAGPLHSPVLMVGQARSTHGSMPGGWLPFTSYLTTQLMYDLDVYATQCSWTNLEDLHPRMLRGRGLIVTFGRGDWSTVMGTDAMVVNVDHPAYTYRFKRPQRVRIDGHEVSTPLLTLVLGFLVGQGVHA